MYSPRRRQRQKSESICLTRPFELQGGFARTCLIRPSFLFVRLTSSMMDMLTLEIARPTHPHISRKNKDGRVGEGGLTRLNASVPYSRSDFLNATTDCSFRLVS